MPRELWALLWLLAVLYSSKLPKPWIGVVAATVIALLIPAL